MTDVSRTIAPKSDQLNADDLIAGPRTIVVTGVRGNDTADQPISVYFEGDEGKPYKPCKSMRRVMVAAWGPQGDTYTGKAMTLYCDPHVKFGGIEVGGIRISHMSHIKEDLTLALTVSRANRKPFKVRKMDAPRGAAQPGPEEVAHAVVKAMAVAMNGTTAFTEWWNSDEGKGLRHLVRHDPEEWAKIQAECKAADADLG